MLSRLLVGGLPRPLPRGIARRRTKHTHSRGVVGHLEGEGEGEGEEGKEEKGGGKGGVRMKREKREGDQR